MAWPIIRVSSVPDAPTSEPETISRSLCRTKPEAAAAMPVNELSSEMTTGMSAPPIGSTKSTPSRSASTPAATSRDSPSLKLMLAASTTHGGGDQAVDAPSGRDR